MRIIAFVFGSIGLMAMLWFVLLSHQPLSIAANVWIGYEPLFQAKEHGWLSPKQVTLVETQSGPASIQAIMDGRVDGAALTLDEMMLARGRGLPLTAVMVFDVSLGADVLLVSPRIKTLAALKNKRIGFEPSSVADVMLLEILNKAQLTKQDIRLIPLPHDKQLAAWQQHQLDAVITYEPIARQLQDAGAVRLFDSTQIPNTIIDVLAIRTDKLDYRHANALCHFIQGHFKALDYFYRNPQDASYRMAEHLGLPAHKVLQAYRGLVLPNIVMNDRLLSGDTPAIKQAAQKLSTMMTKAHLLQQPDPLNDLIDVSYLPEAQL